MKLDIKAKISIYNDGINMGKMKPKRLGCERVKISACIFSPSLFGKGVLFFLVLHNQSPC